MINKFISLDKIFRLIFCPPTYGEEDLMLAFSEKPFTKLNTRKETVTDPNGKKLEIEVITDNQVEAIQKTKGGANSPDSGGTNADTSYYTHKTLKIVLRPDKTQ
jgi:hypothetical protein